MFKIFPRWSENFLTLYLLKRISIKLWKDIECQLYVKSIKDVQGKENQGKLGVHSKVLVQNA
jgi:hypothetical protein